MSLMGELTYFLGLKIKKIEVSLFINQINYFFELLKKYYMKDSIKISTTMDTNLLIDKDEEGVEIGITKYRGIIGSLLYLTVIMPDIMLSVCMCTRFQPSPRESHFKIVKRILRYLNKASCHGPQFLKGNKCSLVGFSNSNSAGSKLDRESTSGTCHMFGNYLVSWHSKKQHSVALSTAKAEYVVIGNFLS